MATRGNRDADALLQIALRAELLSIDVIKNICEETQRILAEEANVVQLCAPITIGKLALIIMCMLDTYVWEGTRR